MLWFNTQGLHTRANRTGASGAQLFCAVFIPSHFLNAAVDLLGAFANHIPHGKPATVNGGFPRFSPSSLQENPN